MKRAQHFVVLLAASALCGFTNSTSVLAHTGPAPLAKSQTQRSVTNVKIRNFALIDQTGKPLDFATLKGKIVIAGFGYTTCPDVCPLITAAMRSVQEQLTASERASVHFLTITTDPELDSASVLAGYAKRYKVDFSTWSFLTGTAADLSAVWKNFGVKVQRKARGLIDHTPLVALIDQHGVMRIAYHGSAPLAQMILEDTRSFIQRKKTG